ncbi:type II toxin-antitoxin system PemK/MazF family toxin [Candidatus Leptofilum sp.]|uniref:type II toxin-antitoxin system PemK/MazF family toxin n=1 Tax=Candidatus Leptofilum sp. TaxID=3241576 RepID=UPI003B597BC8
MKRGEIRWYTFRSPDKRRPVLILTRNSALGVLTGVTIAPLTSTIRNIPTEVVLTPAEDGVLTESAVNLDNLQTVHKAKLGGLIAVLSPDRLDAVERALCFALGIDYLL